MAAYRYNDPFSGLNLQNFPSRRPAQGRPEGSPHRAVGSLSHAAPSLPPLPPAMPRWRRAPHCQRWCGDGRMDDLRVVSSAVRRGKPGRRPWAPVVVGRPRCGEGRASCSVAVLSRAGVEALGRRRRDGPARAASGRERACGQGGVAACVQGAAWACGSSSFGSEAQGRHVEVACELGLFSGLRRPCGVHGVRCRG